MRPLAVLLLFGMASILIAECSGKMTGMKSKTKKTRKGKSTRMMCVMKYNELKDQYTALQTQVEALSNPVHVHVHGITSSEDNVQMSHSHSHDDHGHDQSAPSSHTNQHGHVHRHEHEHGHHSGMMAENKAGGDQVEDGSQSVEGEDGEDSSSEESGSDSESSEERGKGRYKKKGTHVHIHLNLGAAPGAVFAQTNVMPVGEQDGLGVEEAMKISKDYPQEYSFAKCDMMRNSASTTSHDVRGTVYLRQKPGQPLEVTIDLYGFDVRNIRDNQDDPRHLHGFHVHQFGDFSNGCNSFGGHFNPSGHEHGGPDDNHRHAGDWGNIECDHRGVARTTFNETSSTLFGAHSIVGRGMVIHERADDLGKGHSKASKASGDAGGRIACCVISWAKGMW